MSSSRWFPPSFLSFPDLLQKNPVAAGRELDQAIQNLYKQVYTLPTSVPTQPVPGSTTVTGSKLAIAVSGLSTITGVVASLDTGSGAVNEWVSASPSTTRGAIDIYVWKPTGVADTTPIASTTARLVRWIATGTP